MGASIFNLDTALCWPVTSSACEEIFGAGVCLVIGAPLLVQNALPMPVQVLLRPDGYRSAGPTR